MLTQDDKDFIANPFERIEGWCHPEAVAITLYLQRFQIARGWVAPNYEIGAYHGKYLSILQRAAALAGQRTTGIDIFQHTSAADVENGMVNVLGPLPKMTLIQKDSTQYSAEELSEAVGGPASWISLDGDHTAKAVMADLKNAEATLAPWGVIAIDDFVNVNAIGVVEGAIRYLANGNTKLRPFCFSAGKLLVSFEDYTELYHAQVPVFCRDNPQYPMVATFNYRHEHNLSIWLAQTLLDRSIWIIA